MGKKHGKGKRKKINVTNTVVPKTAEPEELINAPHSFVFYRGTVGDKVAHLTKDFRKVMEPFTASALKARKANSVKDFLSVAGVLHVSHMCIFTTAELGTYMKLTRVPRGPTLYFRVLNYSLTRDVVSSIKKQLVFKRQTEHPPLAILNSFPTDASHWVLTASMFQNMFPPINLTKVNLNTVRRCVLFNYNAQSDEIDVRHYAIKIVPVGLSKGVKKIVQSKVPDLSKLDDISEFITKAHILSESEAEDDPANHVTLPQKIASRGNMVSAQSSIRLVELGPRMTLQLIKVEDGFMNGEVLFHKHVTKTEEEKAEIVKRRVEKRRKKEERKRHQAEMVRRKEKLKEEHKQRSLEGMKKKNDQAEPKRKRPETIDEGEDQVDDDADWYRQEVGKEPEHDLFDKKKAEKRKGETLDHRMRKRMKRSNEKIAKPRKDHSKTNVRMGKSKLMDMRKERKGFPKGGFKGKGKRK